VTLDAVLDGVAVACFVGLGLAAALCVVRLVRGPGTPDRIVALDALLIVVVSGIAVGSAADGTGDYLPLLIAVSLLSFVGTVTVARFVERRGVS
jgi:multicomponent Na+:H+ antiporter subunit F